MEPDHPELDEMNGGEIRVLVVDDSDDDARLLLRKLRGAGFAPAFQRVETADQLAAALDGQDWDLALVDHVIPGFDGRRALRMLAERRPGLPAIVVSGKVGEEVVAEDLALGAHDYVLKDSLVRLPAAVTRALGLARVREEKGRAEAALRESEERYRRIVEQANEGIWTLDAEGRTTFVNRRMASLLGYDVTAMEGRRMNDLLLESTAGEAGPPSTQAMVWEGRFARRDGSSLWLLVSSVPVPGHDGAAAGLSAMCTDISARKAAELELSRAKERLESALEGADLGSFDWDIAADTVVCDERCLSMLGRGPDDAVQDAAQWRADSHPDDLEEVERAFVDLARGRRDSWSFVRRHRHTDGRWMWLLTRGKVVEWDEETGLPTRAIGTNLDVTQSQVTGEALRESEAKFRCLVEQASEGIALFDERGTCVEFNAWLRDLTGTSRTRSVGRPIREVAAWLLSEDLRQLAEGVFERMVHSALLNGDPPLFAAPRQTSLTDAAGRERVLSYRWFPVSAWRALYLGCVVVDITERVVLEDSLRQGSHHLRGTLESTVAAMGSMVDIHDSFTAGHERRVTGLVQAIAAEIDLDEAACEGLRLAALVHDVGKVAVPAGIINKPTDLRPEELELVRTHPSVGYEILRPIDFGRPVAEAVLQHHERLDGSGYPRGLRGDAICLEARILAVADVVEAMSSARPYRQPAGLEAALREIEDGAGRLYDPAAVAACGRVLRAGFAFPEEA